MPVVEMSEIDEETSREIWHHISQFVCYEYCRHFRCYVQEPANIDRDLLSFFKEMVVKMTTKTDETSITKHEILARFLDELNAAKTVDEFKVVFQIAQKVKQLCPASAPSVNELIASLRAKLRPLLRSNKSRMSPLNFDVSCISNEINKFCVAAGTLLPQPDLVKMFNCWLQTPETEGVSDEQVLERLKSVMKPEDLPEMLRVLDNDVMFQNCLKSMGIPVPHHPPAEQTTLEPQNGSIRSSGTVAPQCSLRSSEQCGPTIQQQDKDLLSVTTADINENPSQGTSVDSVLRVQLDHLVFTSNTESSSCDFVNPTHFKKPQRPSMSRTRLQQRQSVNIGGSSSGDFANNGTVNALTSSQSHLSHSKPSQLRVDTTSRQHAGSKVAISTPNSAKRTRQIPNANGVHGSSTQSHLYATRSGPSGLQTS